MNPRSRWSKGSLTRTAASASRAARSAKAKARKTSYFARWSTSVFGRPRSTKTAPAEFLSRHTRCGGRGSAQETMFFASRANSQPPARLRPGVMRHQDYIRRIIRFQSFADSQPIDLFPIARQLSLCSLVATSHPDRTRLSRWLSGRYWDPDPFDRPGRPD